MSGILLTCCIGSFAVTRTYIPEVGTVIACLVGGALMAALGILLGYGAYRLEGYLRAGRREPGPDDPGNVEN
jgi:hypothetical protein